MSTPMQILARLAAQEKRAAETELDVSPESRARSMARANEAEAARAAVAELIEAAKAHERVMGHSATLARLRAALSNCGATP